MNAVGDNGGTPLRWAATGCDQRPSSCCLWRTPASPPATPWAEATPHWLWGGGIVVITDLWSLNDHRQQ